MDPEGKNVIYIIFKKESTENNMSADGLNAGHGYGKLGK